MTTIAVTKDEISCDQQATHYTGYKMKVQTKVHLFENKNIYQVPFYLGYSGSIEKAHSVLEWFNNPESKPPINKDSEFIVLGQDKKIYTFINPTKWVLISEPYYAIGSGGHYALGALHAGKNTKEAVAIASKCDPNTGLGIKTFKFK